MKETKNDYLKLNEDFRSGSYKRVYLLYGSEEYLKRTSRQNFRRALVDPEGMNYNAFDASVDIRELISVLDTMPFFSEHRLVVVSSSGFFKKAAPEELCSYLPNMPESSVLVFVEQEVDRRNRLFKMVSELGRVCELGEQDRKILAGWAARYLDKAGKKIRSSTMDRLLDKTGSSMDRIVSEMEKLIARVGSREVVEDEDVEEMVSENVEDRVFDMISEMSLGNSGKAMRYYRDLLTLQEAPMKILALMRRNFNQLLLIREQMLRTQNQKEIAEAAGISPWIARKLTEQARNYTVEGLEGYISRCLRYDEAIKNGNMTDRMAVELLLTV